MKRKLNRKRILSICAIPLIVPISYLFGMITEIWYTDNGIYMVNYFVDHVFSGLLLIMIIAICLGFLTLFVVGILYVVDWVYPKVRNGDE